MTLFGPDGSLHAARRWTKDTHDMFAVRYAEGRSAYIRVHPKAAEYGTAPVLVMAKARQATGELPDGEIVSVQRGEIAVPGHQSLRGDVNAILNGLVREGVIANFETDFDDKAAGRAAIAVVTGSATNPKVAKLAVRTALQRFLHQEARVSWRDSAHATYAVPTARSRLSTSRRKLHSMTPGSSKQTYKEDGS